MSTNHTLNSQEVIEVRNLSKKFDDFHALHDVSFEVRRGEVFGCLGPNGAGKTTTLRILLGLLRPTTGDVRVLGSAPDNNSLNYRKRIAALLEHPGILDELSVYENLEFYARIYRVSDSKKRIEEVMGLTMLETKRNVRAALLSKGMKQKLAIGRILMHDAEIYYFDEPTSGLDPSFQREIRDLLLQLAERNRTVFLNSHNLYEVQEICNRVMFIKEGRTVTVESVDSLFSRFSNLKKEIGLLNVGDKEAAMQLLQNRCLILRKTADFSNVEVLLRPGTSTRDLAEALSGLGIGVSKVRDLPLHLEDIFHDVMNHE